MISIIKSLTSGLRESEDKFSPFAKLDQMLLGSFVGTFWKVQILRRVGTSCESQDPVARLSLSEENVLQGFHVGPTRLQ